MIHHQLLDAIARRRALHERVDDILHGPAQTQGIRILPVEQNLPLRVDDCVCERMECHHVGEPTRELFGHCLDRLRIHIARWPSIPLRILSSLIDFLLNLFASLWNQPK